jgi:hypothetical protein
MLETKTVTNGPMAVQLRRACHDTLPWLISFSLDDKFDGRRLLLSTPPLMWDGHSFEYVLTWERIS